MSGTASRFQVRAGYSPGMRASAYPLPSLSMLPPVAAPPSASGGMLPPAAAPAPTPVSAGARPMDSDPGTRDDGPDTDGPPGMGGNPGVIGGPNGMGMGAIGGAAGALAGAAFGVPGLGVALGALGTMADVRSLNGTLAEIGLAPGVNFGPAFANNMTFGTFGQGARDQFNARVDDMALPAMGFMDGPYGTGGLALGDGLVSDLNKTDAMGTSKTGDKGFSEPGSVLGMDPGKSAPGVAGEKSDFSGDATPADGFAGEVGENTAGGGEDKYMAGGYTGPGHPAAPAGTVHKGEVVIPAHQVARYGLSPLMALVDGSMPPSRLAALARG